MYDRAPQSNYEYYPEFAAKFNLPPAVRAEIKNHVPILQYRQQTEEVFLWWSKNTVNATYLTFVQACLELSKADLARIMCKLCKKGML